MIIFGIDKFLQENNIVIKTKDDKIARVKHLTKVTRLRL